MRLVSVDVEQFRSIEDQQVPVSGLVVLFGPNSAGKTTVLEAVGSLLAREGRLRADPGDDDPLVVGWVLFDLPAAGTPGSEDALLYRALLRGDYNGPGLLGLPTPARAAQWQELRELEDIRGKARQRDAAAARRISGRLTSPGPAGTSPRAGSAG